MRFLNQNSFSGLECAKTSNPHTTVHDLMEYNNIIFFSLNFTIGALQFGKPGASLIYDAFPFAGAILTSANICAHVLAISDAHRRKK